MSSSKLVNRRRYSKKTKLNLMEDQVEAPIEDYLLTSVQEEDANKNIFECGEILLLKNIWRINFKCKYCSTIKINLEEFLSHMVLHELQLSNILLKQLLNGVLLHGNDNNNGEFENSMELISTTDNDNENETNIDEEAECWEEYISDSVENSTVAEDVLLDIINQDLKLHANLMPVYEERDAETQKANFNTENNFEIEMFSTIKYKSTQRSPSPLPLPKTANKNREQQKPSNNNKKNNTNKLNNIFLSKDSKYVGPFVCPECHKVFTRKHNLKRHLLIHSNERPYACEFCDATFSDLDNFRIHRNRHLGVKPYQCGVCHKSFTTTTELTNHKRAHSDEKSFICDVCGNAYKGRTELLKHYRRHTNDYCCQCDICGKKFFEKKYLKKHKKTHENVQKKMRQKIAHPYTNLDEHFELHVIESNDEYSTLLTDHKIS